ncbi:hypothetical protein K438DRAFT_1831542 [Mycena galopus ATCC 62051]|nr:hypothetical protein K438DRAFT_1831542 [Mycena galopus ATCC 62051]
MLYTVRYGLRRIRNRTTTGYPTPLLYVLTPVGADGDERHADNPTTRNTRQAISNVLWCTYMLFQEQR